MARKARPFKSPKDDPEFTKVWNILCGEIMQRENFKRGHLLQLEQLVDMYVEVKRVEALISFIGLTSDTVDRHGIKTTKLRPELNHLQKLRAEIRNYSKHLGLLLVKDSSSGDPDEEEKDDFA